MLQHLGTEVVRWAHNPKVPGSKPGDANFFDFIEGKSFESVAGAVGKSLFDVPRDQSNDKRKYTKTK
jgi:hypothetical protein